METAAAPLEWIYSLNTVTPNKLLRRLNQHDRSCCGAHKSLLDTSSRNLHFTLYTGRLFAIKIVENVFIQILLPPIPLMIDLMLMRNVILVFFLAIGTNTLTTTQAQDGSPAQPHFMPTGSHSPCGGHCFAAV